MSAHLALDFVAEALAQLRRVDSGKPFRVWQGTASGRQVFTLESRKPAWFKSLPVIRQLFNFLEVPTIG